MKGAEQFVIIRPVVTEKSTAANSLNQYVFSVVREANKIAIAKAVEKQFGVKPVSVNVSWVRTKKRTRGRIIGKTKAWKKAVVTLPAGKTIAAAEAK